MKKLLSILGAITLIGTTSTSVIGCGEGETPTPDTRTDLSNLSDNAEITLSSSTQTVAEFKTTLINKLKEDSKFKKLSDTEVDITKSDGITELQDSDFNFGTNINDCKIIYKYGKKNNQSVNLRINISSPSTQDIINELEAKKYEIETNAGPNAFDDLDNNIQKNNFEFITNSIKNEKIKNALEISKFKLNNILTSDWSRSLDSSDFVSGQKLDAVLIFLYIKNQISLKLSINVK